MNSQFKCHIQILGNVIILCVFFIHLYCSLFTDVIVLWVLINELVCVTLNWLLTKINHWDNIEWVLSGCILLIVEKLVFVHYMRINLFPIHNPFDYKFIGAMLTSVLTLIVLFSIVLASSVGRPGFNPSQGPPHTKDVIKMVPE